MLPTSIKGEADPSPGWLRETGARGWCTGKTRGMGWGGRREGASGWGTHVNPWPIRVNVWQKPLQYCKVISLQLIKKKVTNQYHSPEIRDYKYSILALIFYTVFKYLKSKNNNNNKKSKNNTLICY